MPVTRYDPNAAGLLGRIMRGILVGVVWAGAVPAVAHIFIFDDQRVGAPPCEPGRGWKVELFWGIPEENAGNLILAERYVAGREPTATFRAEYIDWPKGPTAHAPDTTFETLGDFLDGYITELSDPDVLDLPFDNFLLRARGNVLMRLRDSSFFDEDPPPPVFFDMGLVALDGGRIFIDPTTILRIMIPEPPDGFRSDDAVVEVVGLYPVQVTYFQHYDPDNEVGAGRAGVELLSCHEDGLELPSGEFLRFRCKKRAGRALPPWYVFDDDQIEPVLDGDFEVDGDVDLADVGRFLKCFTGPENEQRLIEGCFVFDVDDDEDVDLADYRHFIDQVTGPNGCR